MPSILNYIENNARNYPGSIAINTKETSKTYLELWRDTNSFAYSYLRNGLKLNDRVCIFTNNSYEAVIAALGTMRAGGVFVFISPNTPLNKLEEILEDCDSSVLISNIPVAIKKEILFKISLNHSKKEPGWSDFEEWINEKWEGALSSSEVNHIGTIIYTSGSTGHPKGIISTNENILFSTIAINKYLNHTSNDKILSYLPLSFDYGLYQVFLTLSAGATLYLRDSKLFVTEISNLISSESITGLPGLRSLFGYFSHEKFKREKKFSSVRYITNTGDALPYKMINDLMETFPNSEIYSMYGLTECKRVSYLPPTKIREKPESVGIPLEGTSIYLLNDDGRECIPFEQGELYVSGPNVCEGYWNNKSETQKTFIHRNGDKVLKTGDICYLDNDGYLYFVNRKDSMFKSKGYRIEPKEIENFILKEFHELIEAVVVGIPDRLEGKKICLLGISKNSNEVLEYKIKDHCKSMEPWKVPSKILIRESLPLTNTGKLDRKAIVNLFVNEEELSNVNEK
ncbi:class I adenylate-forming enzyme family protein [Alkalihalophilus marmarensis]|uniref:class I adenylate-forming enzyme family protein n=1 Tax=Alkalihalophilus marmarensis TaxID=521377 RepID=UPI002DBDA4FD|nr:class I adenylate-forming enzyme family protein [Alkalihalophilus marmarensis]MEC2074254.1 class I adenylate-forming enzyme family protein [Alkalihalophilus marmarensis]